MSGAPINPNQIKEAARLAIEWGGSVEPRRSHFDYCVTIGLNDLAHLISDARATGKVRNGEVPTPPIPFISTPVIYAARPEGLTGRVSDASLPLPGQAFDMGADLGPRGA